MTQQINQAYVMLLSSQFQGFCRDLHSECVDVLAHSILLTGTTSASPLQKVLRLEFLHGRKLETGNPNPGNIGNDFNRFGFRLFDTMLQKTPKVAGYKQKLEALNLWRNAIGHQDFSSNGLGKKKTVSLRLVRVWRDACDKLATTMDDAMYHQIHLLLGKPPW